MHTYELVKHVHMGAAAASGVVFLLRGLWMMQESKLQDATLVRVVPHIIDTVLLLSALTLVVMLGSFPTWVEVKILALFAYVALGVISFRFAKGWSVKVLVFFMALLVYAFILSVAITKNPHGFLGHFI